MYRVRICSTRVNQDFRYRFKKPHRLLKKDLDIKLQHCDPPNLSLAPPRLKGRKSDLLMKISLMICLGHVPQHLSIDRTWRLPPTRVLWDPQNRRSFACLTLGAWCSRCPLSLPSGSDPTQTVHKQMLLCYKSCLQEAVVGVVLGMRQSQDRMNKLLEQKWNTGLLILNLQSQIPCFIMMLDFHFLLSRS